MSTAAADVTPFVITTDHDRTVRITVPGIRYHNPLPGPNLAVRTTDARPAPADLCLIVDPDRVRCTLIVAVDGEPGPQLHFGAADMRCFTQSLDHGVLRHTGDGAPSSVRLAATTTAGNSALIAVQTRIAHGPTVAVTLASRTTTRRVTIDLSCQQVHAYLLPILRTLLLPLLERSLHAQR